MAGVEAVQKALDGATSYFKADPSNCNILSQYSKLLERAGLPSAALLAAEWAFASDATNPTLAASVTLAMIALGRQVDAVVHFKTQVVPVVEARMRALRARASSDDHDTNALESERHEAVWPAGVIATRFSESGWHDEAAKCADEVARLDIMLEGHSPTCTALVNCILGDALVKCGGSGRVGDASDGAFISAAIERFERAVRAAPRDVRSHAGLADVLKDRGDFKGALEHYRMATRLSNYADPVHVFNQAQCLEYIGDYTTAIEELDSYRAKFAEPADPSQQLQHSCVPLLLTKLLFLSGRRSDAMRVQLLLDESGAYTADFVMELRRAVPSHWAYVHFIRSLFANPPLPPAAPAVGELTEPRLAVVGDSHCLTLAWQHINFQGIKHVAVPHLVTGLKVWHMRAGLKFLTRSNLALVLKSLPLRSPVLFTAGEIDCREGILRAVQSGHYPGVQEAVEATVRVLVDALVAARAEFGHRFFVLPVPPPSAQSSGCQSRSRVVALFNAATASALKNTTQSGNEQSGVPDGIQVLNYATVLSVSGSGGIQILDPSFEADGIHLNSSIIPIIEEHLERCI